MTTAIGLTACAMVLSGFWAGVLVLSAYRCICPHRLEPGAEGIYDPLCPTHKGKA